MICFSHMALKTVSLNLHPHCCDCQHTSTVRNSRPCRRPLPLSRGAPPRACSSQLCLQAWGCSASWTRQDDGIWQCSSSSKGVSGDGHGGKMSWNPPRGTEIAVRLSLVFMGRASTMMERQVVDRPGKGRCNRTVECPVQRPAAADRGQWVETPVSSQSGIWRCGCPRREEAYRKIAYASSMISPSIGGGS